MFLLEYKIRTDPVSHSVALSAIFAALPVLTLFILLGVVRMKAWLASVISLGVALVVALVVYGMPFGQSLLSASEGATFGFFPILWIVLNAIWVYNLTVASGHSDVLRRSMERVSPDMRVQAIVIAFCFGALIEALAGFGTPVAITVVMLIALGFRPIHAASLSLIANTAPVAYGALATPILTLATVTHGANDDPRLTMDTLGAMVGRQTPFLALIVPLVLVAVVDGRRGLRQAWPAALTAGVAFGLGQFIASNFISVPLTDVVASLVSALAVVGLVRVWRPVESPDLHAERLALAGAGGAGSVGVVAVGGGGTGGAHRATGSTGGEYTAGETLGEAPGEQEPRPPVDVTGREGGGREVVRDSRAEVARAYAPYLIIIAVFTLANIGPIKTALTKRPWSYSFHWPGLDILNTAGKPLSSMTFSFAWLSTPGTLMIIAGILTAIVLRVAPARAIRTYGETYVELRWAILTVMAVLALAYVLNQSGQTNTLSALLATAGSLFVFLSSILGWLGVAVTGSDTSSNALFGALQVQTAARTGLDPVLLAASNSSGGVMGKMISPQNLAIAAGAVGMAGREGDIFRKVFGWSLLLLLFMCILVTLQGTPVLSWMVP
jgi:lactate permease